MQRKGMTRLMGLQFKVVYRRGKENVAADALSRMGHLMAIQLVSSAQPVWAQEVLNSYATDPHAKALLSRLAISNPDSQGYSLHSGLIRYKDKIWIDSNSALQTKLIAALHSSAVGGHSSQLATYHRVKRLFSWKRMRQDVEHFVKQCQIFQQAKHLNTHSPGLLQPLPVPQGVWQDISLDFVEGLPKSDGHEVILVVVDKFTKYAHFFALKHPYSAISVAKVFYDGVIKLHGLPQTIVSDRT